MWIQKIRTTWFSGINIKVCSLLFLILTHHSLSLCTQNQRCDPGLVFPRSLPVNTQWICTACFPVFCSAKLKSSKPWNSSIPRMAKFWPLNHFWVSYKWREERKEKKKIRQPGKRPYASIFKERLILLQISQVNLRPVKSNRGIPNKRHQAWHVPWYLHSNGENSFTGRTPKMIYYLNQHSSTDSTQADFSPSLPI